MNYSHFNNKELQRFKAFLSQVEKTGPDDIKKTIAAIEAEEKRRFKTGVEMSKKATLEAERKKAEYKNTPVNNDTKCPECDKGVLVEKMREGVLYKACIHDGKLYGCGYSKMLGAI